MNFIGRHVILENISYAFPCSTTCNFKDFDLFQSMKETVVKTLENL